MGKRTEINIDDIFDDESGSEIKAEDLDTKTLQDIELRLLGLSDKHTDKTDKINKILKGRGVR